jgi:hypothetical protein
VRILHLVSVIEFPSADKPITESEIDKLHCKAFRNLEGRLSDRRCDDCRSTYNQRSRNEWRGGLCGLSRLRSTGEAPAPIGQEAQPATDRQPRKMAQAVTVNTRRLVHAGACSFRLMCYFAMLDRPLSIVSRHFFVLPPRNRIGRIFSSVLEHASALRKFR